MSENNARKEPICKVCDCLEDFEDVLDFTDVFIYELKRKHLKRAEEAEEDLDLSLHHLGRCVGMGLGNVTDRALIALEKAKRGKWEEAVTDASLIKPHLFHVLCGREKEFLEELEEE